MANPWGRFFWNDWEQEPSLRLSSLAAQGLWMRLLCLAAKSDPIGYLTLAGRALNLDDLSILIGRPGAELAPLMDELERNGVFSRDAKGRIYSRRLVRDTKSHAEAKKFGKLGGNPSLSNQTEKVVPLKASDKPPLKPHSHIPLPVSIASIAGIDEECSEEILPSRWQDVAEALDIPNEQIFKSWRKFKDMTSFPYQLSRWKAWIAKERGAKPQLEAAQ